MEEAPDDTAPGWDAIDSAFVRLYGDTEPLHYGTILRYSLGGPDPLDGISFYPSVEGPRHWHVVTYGFSALYQRGDDEEPTEESGFGFELTLRLARDPGEEEPPVWACNFLQNLARYVFESGNTFDVGHHLDLRGPIALERDTRIVAIAFAADPHLPDVDTPNGSLKFLQVVGITAEEYTAMRRWDTTRVLDLMRERDPLLVTNLDRPSYLEDEAFAAEVERGRASEGSSQGALFASTLDWSMDGEAEITLGASVVEALREALPGRLPFGRSFEARGPEKAVRFRPLATPGCVARRELLVVSCPPDFTREVVETLRPQRGVYRCLSHPQLRIRVVPSEIKDGEGRVVRVIG